MGEPDPSSRWSSRQSSTATAGKDCRGKPWEDRAVIIFRMGLSLYLSVWSFQNVPSSLAIRLKPPAKPAQWTLERGWVA